MAWGQCCWEPGPSCPFPWPSGSVVTLPEPQSTRKCECWASIRCPCGLWNIPTHFSAFSRASPSLCKQGHVTPPAVILVGRGQRTLLPPTLPQGLTRFPVQEPVLVGLLHLLCGLGKESAGPGTMDQDTQGPGRQAGWDQLQGKALGCGDTRLPGFRRSCPEQCPHLCHTLQFVSDTTRSR